MASSRGSSNGVDWIDIATAIAQFEQMDNVDLRLRMVLGDKLGTPSLEIDCAAWKKGERDQGVLPWVLVSA